MPDDRLGNIIKCLEEDYEVFGVLEDGIGRSIIAWDSKNYLYGDNGDFLDDLNNMLRKHEGRPVRHGDFIYGGSAIGYISYDAVRLWEKVVDLKPQAESWPYAEFFIPENIAVYERGRISIIYGEGEEYLMKCLRKSELRELRVSLYDKMLDRENYIKAVEEVLGYIREGRVSQLVLSRFYRYTYDGDPASLYEKLRALDPSPFMYYLRFQDRRIIGSSPELLFKLYNNIIETHPIAGTRPRGRNDEEDKELEKELINSIKDRDEHLMLLDLAREDLAKICVKDTINIPERLYVGKFGYVQHLISKVTCRLQSNCTVYDAVKALFPAGTVTGTPKLAALNLIEVLEDYKRGPYAGAVGYINYNGDAEFAIAIRTAFINKELLRIQAGAGIIHSSIPELEYQETKYKLLALKKALEVA